MGSSEPYVVVETSFLDWDRTKPVIYSRTDRRLLGRAFRVVFEIPHALHPGTLAVIEMGLEWGGRGEGKDSP